MPFLTIPVRLCIIKNRASGLIPMPLIIQAQQVYPVQCQYKMSMQMEMSMLMSMPMSMSMSTVMTMYMCVHPFVMQKMQVHY